MPYKPCDTPCPRLGCSGRVLNPTSTYCGRACAAIVRTGTTRHPRPMNLSQPKAHQAVEGDVTTSYWADYQHDQQGFYAAVHARADLLKTRYGSAPVSVVPDGAGA